MAPLSRTPVGGLPGLPLRVVSKTIQVDVIGVNEQQFWQCLRVGHKDHLPFLSWKNSDACYMVSSLHVGDKVLALYIFDEDTW